MLLRWAGGHFVCPPQAPLFRDSAFLKCFLLQRLLLKYFESRIHLRSYALKSCHLRLLSPIVVIWYPEDCFGECDDHEGAVFIIKFKDIYTYVELGPMVSKLCEPKNVALVRFTFFEFPGKKYDTNFSINFSVPIPLYIFLYAE